MKRTPYTIKAERARKAWKSLKEQTRTKTDDQTDKQLTSTMEYKFSEMVQDA